MNIFALGARNAFRNRTRTLAVILILGISLGLALVMLLSLNSVRSRVTQLSGSLNNTVTVTPAGSFGGFGGGGNPLTTAQVAEITSTPHVTSVVASIQDQLTNEAQQSSGFGFGNRGSTGTTSLTSPITPGRLGQAFNGGGTLPAGFSLPVEVFGTTDPSNAATLGATSWTLEHGAVIASTDTTDVADVGTALASKNGLTVGSTFTAYKKTFTVVGIFKTNTQRGNAAILVPLGVESKLSGTNGPTQAVATVDSIGNVASVTSHLESTLGSSVQVTSSQTNAQTISASFSSIKTISLYSLIGALVAAAVILLMSMLMIVRDRRREIGIFKSFGAPNRAVVSLFVVEALVVAALAGIFGLLLSLVLADPIIGALSNSATTSGGGRFGGPGGAGGSGGGPPRFTTAGFGRVASQLHAALGASTVLYAVLAVAFIAVVGSAVPAFVIAKVRPAEVLRGE